MGLLIAGTAGQDFPILAGGAGATAIITNPVDGGTVTSRFIDIDASIYPLAVAFRVVIWEGAISATTAPVYDSGVLVPVDNSGPRISPFLEDNTTYNLRLYVVAMSGDRTYADVEFTTDYSAASDSPVFVRARTVGMVGQQDPDILPRVILEWPAGSAHEFVVMKSDNGGPFYAIAVIDPPQTGRFEDANVCSGHTYQYKVGDLIYTTSEQVNVNFEHAFIHPIRNVFQGYAPEPGFDDFIRFESWEHTQVYGSDMELVLPTGRQVPTARFRETLARKYNIRGLPQVRTNRELFEGVKRLIDSQVKYGYQLCLRLGRDKEMIFGAVGSVTLQATQAVTNASIEFNETFWREELDFTQFSASGYNNAFLRYTE